MSGLTSGPQLTNKMPIAPGASSRPSRLSAVIFEIVAWYCRNKSDERLARRVCPLLADTHDGDILLVEQVDRLSRLTEADWQILKADLDDAPLRVVALDFPTSWMMAAKAVDEFTSRMFEAINRMLLDMLAVFGAQGLHRPSPPTGARPSEGQAEGLSGPPEDTARNEGIAKMLAAGPIWRLRTGRPRAAAAPPDREVAKRLKVA